MAANRLSGQARREARCLSIWRASQRTRGAEFGLLRVGAKVRREILRKGKRRSVELVIRKAAENR